MDFAPQVGRDETHNGTMRFEKSPRGEPSIMRVRLTVIF